MDRHNYKDPKDYLQELYDNTPIFDDELPIRNSNDERNLWNVMSQYLVGSLKDKSNELITTIKDSNDYKSQIYSKDALV